MLEVSLSELTAAMKASGLEKLGTVRLKYNDQTLTLRLETPYGVTINRHLNVHGIARCKEGTTEVLTRAMREMVERVPKRPRRTYAK